MPRILAQSSSGKVIERHNGAVVKFTGLPMPKLPRHMKAIQQEALEELALWWRKKFGPRHFHPRAYSQYGKRFPNVYQRRKGTPAWMEKKFEDWRAAPHTTIAGQIVPLYRSGQLKTAFLSGTFKVTPSGAGVMTKVRATWPGLPRHTYYFNPARIFNQTTKPPLKHDKVVELTMTSEQDEARMGKKLNEIVAKLMGR